MLLEAGREVEGPKQEFSRMTQREYKELLEQRDEKERNEAERLRREKDLLEKRRARQVERAAAIAGLEGAMRIDVGVAMEELYQQNGNAKDSFVFRPSRLPIRNIKTADSKQRKFRDGKRTEAGKVYKYDNSIFLAKFIESHRNQKAESAADEFNKNILADSEDLAAAKRESRPATARERILA